MIKALKNIQGAGGGGRSPQPPRETPNSLITSTTAKVLFLPSRGETGGLFDQANPLKSVYLNNIPIQNADGSYNNQNALVEERYGLPSQTVMPGFTTVSSAFNIGTKVLVSTPATFQTTVSDVDALRITIRFPALYQTQDNGDITATSVQFGVYVRLGGNAWALYQTHTVTDKTNSAADVDYQIPRPSGSGTWGVQIRRVTADNALSSLANDIFLQTATQLNFAALEYNDRALVGLTLTADQVGAQYPTVAFDYVGIKVKVPNNYNPVTRVYTGEWSGTFSAPVWTDNPAWHLYYLLTDPDAGLGIAEADIDKFSFYEAAKYNDGLVPALANGTISGTEPRYTFNHQYLDKQEDAWVFLQNLASSFGAAVYTAGNLVKLVQDRPTNFSRIISNSNVIDGSFSYSSSALPTRTTACIVYWMNPAENWLAVPAYYEDSVGVSRYGLNVTEVQGIGVTSEGQALRLAKWNVETSISNLATVSFKVGFENAGIAPGDVVKIADSDFMQVMNEAVVINSTASSITLDKPVSVSSGNTFDAQSENGTVETRTISATSSGTVVSYSGNTLTVVPGAKVIFTTAIAPRLFKITAVREEQMGEWLCSGIQYDPNKFGRVDSTPTGNVPVFQQVSLIPSAPLNLSVRESAINDKGNIRRNLLISWSRPVQGVVSQYFVSVFRNGALFEEFEQVGPTYELINAIDGSYIFEVSAISANNVRSSKASISYTLDITGGTGTTLLPPTNLQCLETGTPVFEGRTLTVRFTNPLGNATNAKTLRNFSVQIKDSVTNLVLREFDVPAVDAGSTQIASYPYDDNIADGGPRRVIHVEVRCRDTNNKLTAATAVTFNNPAPAVPSNIVLTGLSGGAEASFDPVADTDLRGYALWASDQVEFIPAASNLISTGNETRKGAYGFASGVPLYVRLAAYDDFTSINSLETGLGLNLSPELSVTPAAAGISGLSMGVATLYTWAPVAPSNPSGTSTWTWATAAHTAYSGPVWSLTIPVNPGTPGIRLWTATKSVVATAGTTSTTVDWTTGFLVSAVSSNGVNGAAGARFGTAKVFQWASSIPSIAGTNTWTWATGAISGTLPAGWSGSAGPAPSAGLTLWEASVNLIDSASTLTSTISWTSSTINAVGFAGGTGASSRISYVKTSATSLGTGTVVTTGSTSLPPNGSFGASGWSANTLVLAVGESLYQSDGIFDPATNQTTWQAPYLSSFRVGSLSAITINTGALNIQDTLSVGTTGAIRSGSSTYGSAGGFFLGYTSGSYRFSLGDRLTFDGTTLSLNASSVSGLGALATQNTVAAGSVTGLAAVATSGQLAWGSVTSVPSNVVNATVNRIFRQSTAPTGTFFVGDIWYQTRGSSGMATHTWNGSSWVLQIRAPITTSRAIGGSAWNDLEASAAISARGYVDSPGDTVNLFNTSVGFSETRMLNPDSNGWVLVSLFINGNVVIDGTLSGNKIIAGSIAANRLSVSSLSAITTTTGSLNVNGAVSIATGGKITSGVTEYNQIGTGFYLDSLGIFRLGNQTGPSSGGNHLKWDGSSLIVSGGSIQGGAIFGGGSSAAYAWAASGTGYHLSSSGLAIGNANINGGVELRGDGGYALIGKNGSARLEWSGGVLSVTGGVITGGTIANSVSFDSFTASISGGTTANVSNGSGRIVNMGTVTPSGGKTPYSYAWSLSGDYPYGSGNVGISSGATSTTLNVSSTGSNSFNVATGVCTVTDANGRSAVASKSVTINHGTPGILP